MRLLHFVRNDKFSIVIGEAWQSHRSGHFIDKETSELHKNKTQYPNFKTSQVRRLMNYD